jgi:hypothetical protein
MEKKRNRVTQNTAVTAHFEGRRVDCQIAADVSEKSILTGPFPSEDESLRSSEIQATQCNTAQNLNFHQHR